LTDAVSDSAAAWALSGTSMPSSDAAETPGTSIRTKRRPARALDKGPDIVPEENDGKERRGTVRF